MYGGKWHTELLPAPIDAFVRLSVYLWLKRDENLITSLQCMRDSRVLEMLYSHRADRCRGMGIVDHITRRNKNAYFYNLDIAPIWYQPSSPWLYCVSKSVISTCIRGIVEYYCGTMTADFVQAYLIHLQDVFDQAVQAAGLHSNICDRDINSNILASKPPIPSGHSFSGLAL